MKTRHLTFVLSLLLLMNLLLSCTPDDLVDFGVFDGLGDISDLCINTIEYHKSDNCDDIVTKLFLLDENLDYIESVLSEKEIGECVGITLENLEINIRVVNDTNKSWLVSDCRK